MPTTTPSAADIDVFLRKHRDFRGISERGLCVLVFRNGTCSVPVSALTAEERASVMSSRRGRFSAEERRDAAQCGVVLPAATKTTKEKLF